jgi:hypothetical protein
MVKDELRKLLNQPYKSDNWKKITEFVFPNVSYLQKPQEIPFESDKVESFKQIGNVKLSDGKNLAMFEVHVAENVNLASNRVELRKLVAPLIDQERNHGVLVIYEQGKEDYRFTFTAKSTEFDEAEGDFKNIETDAKRFTYILGKNESCKTAANRFWELSGNKEKATIKDVEQAFSVERLNKEFFDKYKNFYENFVQHITGKRFEKEKGKWVEKTKGKAIPEHKTVFGSDDKLARNFVKLLLGRLVFIQFLQKKEWMGVPANSKKWKNGEKDFLNQLFNSTKKKDQFHSNVLHELFYKAFNKPNRPNDIFELTGTRVPYLNGGLFENEYSKTELINFPTNYFQDLLDFFGQYNFTIDENDPLDHEVGIDPEMLGHIFENLLEDNKDKGAFYTPKPVVQFMCQESLIQYLKTYLVEHNKWSADEKAANKLYEGLQNFVKKKIASSIIDFDEDIAIALRDVKICDPAIGSGAFPMGLLNEIFYCIQVLYNASPDVVGEIWEMNSWQADIVKKNIIQHSIYGVDLEKGAVDIARLRFWLSLIVDEKEPYPLPNLDFKIMQGDSLLESYEGIDLSKIAVNKTQVTEIDLDLFGNPKNSQVTIFDTKYIDDSNITTLIEDYFTAQIPEKKQSLKLQIDNIIHKHIDYNLEFEENKIKITIADLEFKIKGNKVVTTDSKGVKEKKEKTLEKLIKGLNNEKAKLRNLQTKRKDLHEFQNKAEKPYFLWHLYFKDVFDLGGFDIVIGNPPYGTSIKGDYRKYIEDTIGKVPDYEIYYYFNEIGYQKLKENGVLSYIIPNTYLFNVYASEYRKKMLSQWEINCILDCTRFKIFEEASVFNCINILIKDSRDIEVKSVGFKPTGAALKFSNLINEQTVHVSSEAMLANNQNWGIVFKLKPEVLKVISKIKNNSIQLDEVFPEFSQGLIAYDKYQGQTKEVIESRAYHYTSKAKAGLKYWLWGEDVTRYQVKWNGKEYIDYGAGIANPRDPKFFKGNRILVREITNPTVFAAITDEELYHDPAVIVIKGSKKGSIKMLLGLLNSKIASFYHFNSSPKATKGGFPKILVEDIKNFPLPKEIEKDALKVIENLVDNILEFKSKSDDTTHYEKDIDLIFYKLFDLTYEDVKIIDAGFEMTNGKYNNYKIG